jgi:hypothetical protein
MATPSDLSCQCGNIATAFSIDDVKSVSLWRPILRKKKQNLRLKKHYLQQVFPPYFFWISAK